MLERHGRLDVLVNNVGHFVHPGKPFVDSTEDEWQDLFAVNLQHVLRVTHAALPPMIEQGDGGSIINLTTVEAFRGIPHHPVYAAYKAGVTQFGRSLALDVGRHGIRVNDIAPDVTRSLQLPYERWLTEDDEARIPTWVPLGRLGEPRDAAGAAVFLASDLSQLRHRHHHPLRRRHLRGRRLVPQRPGRPRLDQPPPRPLTLLLPLPNLWLQHASPRARGPQVAGWCRPPAPQCRTWGSDTRPDTPAGPRFGWVSA